MEANFFLGKIKKLLILVHLIQQPPRLSLIKYGEWTARKETAQKALDARGRSSLLHQTDRQAASNSFPNWAAAKS